MLKLVIPESEVFDESTNEFVKLDEVVLELEHSLVSLSKWESIYEKPFISQDKKTDEQTIAYVKAMCLNSETPIETFNRLTSAQLNQITEYIDAKMTATWFADKKDVAATGKKEIVTAEVIYYWLVALTIPFECQYWHLSRLLTLIRVCNEKNAPPEKKKRITQSDIARRKALNEQRKAQMRTSG